MSDPSPPSRRDPSFVAQIIGDVIHANDRRQIEDSPANRRDVIRTSFAAIEGLTWLMRDHVRKVSEDMGYLTVLSNLALQEQTYSVTSHGVVKERLQFMPLLTAIRLSVRQVRKMLPDLDVDFSHSGWEALSEAVTVRHRGTHPKTVADLTVTIEDMSALNRAMSWLLATTEFVMAGANLVLRSHNDQARLLLDKLRSGDPASLTAYRHALDRAASTDREID